MKHVKTAKTNDTRTCPVCGAEFSPENPRRVYCSEECVHKHKNLAAKKRYADNKAYRDRNRENRRRWGEIHGENMGSWRNIERTNLYARRAVGALDGETRELLGLLLSNGNGYSRALLTRWFEQPNLGSVLNEIKAAESCDRDA